MKCVFFGYYEGLKGYRVWKTEIRGSRFNIYIHVTFDETRTRRKSKDLKVKESKTLMENTQIEVEVHYRNTKYKEEGKAPTPSSTEGKFTMTPIII